MKIEWQIHEIYILNCHLGRPWYKAQQWTTEYYIEYKDIFGDMKILETEHGTFVSMDNLCNYVIKTCLIVHV